MRTAIFKGVGIPLAIERRTDSVPGPGEVVARVDRVGACRAGIHMNSGQGQHAPAGIKLGDRVAPMAFFSWSKRAALELSDEDGATIEPPALGLSVRRAELEVGSRVLVMGGIQ